MSSTVFIKNKYPGTEEMFTTEPEITPVLKKYSPPVIFLTRLSVKNKNNAFN